MQPKTILKALGAVFDECLEFIHWLLHENSKRFSTYLPNLRISYDSTFHLAKVWSYWSKTRGVANQSAFFFCGLDSVPETNVRKLENVTAHSAYLISKKKIWIDHSDLISTIFGQCVIELRMCKNCTRLTRQVKKNCELVIFLAFFADGRTRSRPKSDKSLRSYGITCAARRWEKFSRKLA